MKNADIQEVIMYNILITTKDRKRVEKYLYLKYNEKRKVWKLIIFFLKVYFAKVRRHCG